MGGGCSQCSMPHFKVLDTRATEAENEFLNNRRVCYFLKVPNRSSTVTETVHSVKDGETMVLSREDHPRLRLLGIDLPEMSKRAPHARECYDFLRRRCPEGTKVTVEYNGCSRRDMSGRLALVYVPHHSGDGFVCLNAALLEMGLAYLYASRQAGAQHTDVLNAALLDARHKKRGIWRHVNEKMPVVVSPTGEVFHRVDNSCVHRDRQEMTLGEALNTMRSPCHTCRPL
ncbi:micrococcal nuclease [Trypanosoma grayi]|uniref:micrococcal nuclease n=1 Tax=Trypanosoma grayi TaxID=71804 RepID=UPI0004F4963C|nr:micrococcal nuclease [Trypanosoma grayi]KEG07804.1 micrococcal nuclease [Trypanosoma grayi]